MTFRFQESSMFYHRLERPRSREETFHDTYRAHRAEPAPIDDSGVNRRNAHALALALAGVLALGSSGSASAFDLSRAERRVLDNGLSVLVLEAPALPVVSVQMLYRVGARDEPSGLTGIAHFLEHMAFRATENFPDTGVVSEIYAVGGEWHGYTWLDQTTYFETLPVEYLDLALRIEADRMMRLLIPEADVEAERGAVLAEMHGYDNDPASRVKDAVLQVSFLQHPYRNNTIGWESDVEAIGREDVTEFYRRHYRPSNAVLAIVGRVSAPGVFARVGELFGGFPLLAASRPPATVEPRQEGVRRIVVGGAGARPRFEVAYRAPAVTDPDFPAFLLLQQVLAGGLGVNFAQNEFGDPVRAGRRLDGVADDLVSWFPPQEMPYVLTFAGSVDPGTPTDDLEQRLESAIARLRREPPSATELEAARNALLDELIFDLETTEDAAHQLAYFEGIGELEVLLGLPRSLAGVEPEDVRRLAAKYLAPERRTIAWYTPEAVAKGTGFEPGAEPVAEAVVPPADALAEPPASPTSEPQAEKAARGPAVRPAETALPLPTRASERLEEVSGPVVESLSGGLPVLFRRMPLSSSAHLRMILPGASVELPAVDFEVTSTSGWPLWRRTSVELRFRPGDLAAALQAGRRIAEEAKEGAPLPASEIDDPAGRLATTLDELSGASAGAGTPRPIVIAIAGHLAEKDVRALAEEILGSVVPGKLSPGEGFDGAGEVTVKLEAKSAQAQLGYVVAAPGARDPDWLAWRLLLYVLSHGYEGRMGKEAISRRGLVYWIDANHRTDGIDGRVSLEIGVDPKNLDAMRQLFAEALRGLAESPPSEAEVAEAKAHLLGRRRSAAQSNAEITAALAEEFVGHGRLLSDAEFAANLDAVSRSDVLRVVPAFVEGVTVVVEVGR